MFIQRLIGESNKLIFGQHTYVISIQWGGGRGHCLSHKDVGRGERIRDFKIQILRTTDYGREVFGTGTRHMFSLHSTVASSRRCVVEGVFVVNASWVRKQKR